MTNLSKYIDAAILIVDDDQSVRDMVTRLITKEHLVDEDNIFSAKNGLDAYEQYLDNHPDLIITDAVMPYGGGIELIQKIRAIDNKTQIILATGHADIEMAKEAIKIGVSELITKPFQSDELILTVTRSLQSILIQKEIDNLKKRLLAAERLSSLGLLSAGVAHEINNPNCFIKGNLELIEKYVNILLPLCNLIDISNNPEKKKIEIAKKSIKSTIDTALIGTERIHDIVNGLLSFSRDSKTYKEIISFDNIIKDACQIASCKILKYKVIINVPPGLPNVNVSKQEITQVVMNLLVNSADALESNKSDTNTDKYISLNVRHLDDQSKIEFRITDNAGGVPKDLQIEIFEPFFTTKPLGKGTGLGLSISKDNVENNGGTIRCESDAEEETSFIIELPIAEA